MNKNKHIRVIKLASIPKKTKVFSEYCAAILNTSSKLIVPKKKNIKNIPIARPKSPTLFTIKALIAALFADSFLY